MAKHKETYEGYLHEAEEGGLHIKGEAIAKLVTDSIREHGSFLTVRHWIAQQPINPETVKLEWLKQLYTGSATAEHKIQASESTGYLYTDEELIVGGHDLMAELYVHEGEYIYMEIEYSKSA